MCYLSAWIEHLMASKGFFGFVACKSIAFHYATAVKMFIMVWMIAEIERRLMAGGGFMDPTMGAQFVDQEARNRSAINALRQQIDHAKEGRYSVLLHAIVYTIHDVGHTKPRSLITNQKIVHLPTLPNDLPSSLPPPKTKKGGLMHSSFSCACQAFLLPRLKKKLIFCSQSLKQ